MRVPEYIAEFDLLSRNSCSKYFGSQMKYPASPRMVNTLLPLEHSRTGLRIRRRIASLNPIIARYYKN